MATFDPQQITIRPAHRPGSLQLLVDGTPVPSGNLISLGAGPDGRVHYHIEDLPLCHGALVRVDYDPSWGEP